MRVAVLIAALAAAAVGCGTGASSTAATDGATRLTITYWPQGVAKQGLAKQGVAKPAAGTWTLRCAPAGGTLPRPGKACAKLAALPKPFAPIPKDAVCTEIYGGPQLAIVKGTLRGRRIHATLQRRNGCEISRFDKHAFLVPGFRPGAGGEA